MNANADTSLQDENGATALHLASESGHTELVGLLMSNESILNIRSVDGSTAVFVASQNGHFEVVELLLKANADPQLQKTDGTGPSFNGKSARSRSSR